MEKVSKKQLKKWFEKAGEVVKDVNGNLWSK